MPLLRIAKLVPEAVFRRILHGYWRIARGMTLGVRGVVVDREGRVCLIRHTYIAGWHLPGGGVETGETALDALSRELDEEACILPSGSPRLHGVFFNRKISRRDHVLVYVLDRYTARGVKAPDKEILEAGFFPVDALPDGTSAATRRRLAEIFGGRPIASEW